MSDLFIRVSEHGGFQINEYNGSYSLNSAWESKDGAVRQNWGKRQQGKDKYAEKATPIKVEIGDKATAEAVLLTALKEITGKDYFTSDENRKTPPTQDDIPF